MLVLRRWVRLAASTATATDARRRGGRSRSYFDNCVARLMRHGCGPPRPTPLAGGCVFHGGFELCAGGYSAVVAVVVGGCMWWGVAVVRDCFIAVLL